MSRTATAIRSTKRERLIPGAPAVELIPCTSGRCTGCGRDATIAAHRVGSFGSALDVAWCSRECRARNVGVSL